MTAWKSLTMMASVFPCFNRSPCQLNTQYIGDIVTEINPVEDEGLNLIMKKAGN